MSKFSSPFLKKSPLNNEAWYNKIMPDFVKNWVARGSDDRPLDLEKVASTKRTWQDLSRNPQYQTPHLSAEMIADAPKIQVEHPITKKPVNMPFPYIKSRKVEDNWRGGMKNQVVHTQGGEGNRVDYIPSIDALNAADTPYNDKVNPQVHELAREMVTDSLNLVNRGMGGQAINLYGENLGRDLRQSGNPNDFSKRVHTVLSNDGTNWFDAAKSMLSRGGRGYGHNVATGTHHTDTSNESSTGSSLTRPNKVNRLITNMYNWYTGK